MIKPELAARVESWIVRPEALPPDVHRIATEAMQNGFAAVVVAPVYVKRVATMIDGSVRTAAVVSFPHGTSKSTLKAIEATSCIKDGADQIDVVAHLPNLMRRDLDAAKVELLEIVRAARATRRDVTINVIIESAMLTTEEQLADACRAVRESGCDGIVSSTGYHSSGGASAQAVALLKKHAGEISVKAAGGIVDLESAQRLIDAGADRVAVEGFIE